MPVPAGHSRWRQRVRLRSEDVEQEQLANRLCGLFLFCVSKCSAHIVKTPWNQRCYRMHCSHLQQQIDPSSKNTVFLHATATLMVAMSDGTTV